MIIRIIGSIVIVSACSFIGIELSKQLRGRVKTLESWQNALLQLENYIYFTKMPLAEIYVNLSETEDEAGKFFSRLIQYDVQKMDTKKLWETELKNILFISKEDKGILMKLAKTLGAGVSDTQINNIELAKNSIEKNLSEAKELEKRDAKMYKTISFFVGVGIAILLC